MGEYSYDFDSVQEKTNRQRYFMIRRLNAIRDLLNEILGLGNGEEEFAKEVMTTLCSIDGQISLITHNLRKDIR